MIAVRLRAMQLGVRDPPSWAQTTMCVATAAVATQAMCNLCSCSRGFGEEEEEDDFREDKRPDSILSKVAAIVLEAMQRVAAAVLYASVAVLAVTLLLMDPVVQH